MKMEVVRRAVIAADGTTATELLDENPLDALVTPSDRLADAALATEPAVAVSMVNSGAMSAAFPRDVVA
jgi:hypothetical protein